MLTFFRRIRKGLLESSQTRKYLLYAIGEIALVVIGILIALQINNWNEWKKDRVQEQEILTELKNTMEVNSELLKDHISVINGLNETSDKVIALIENNGDYSDEYEDDFYYSFYSGTNIYLSNDGYEGLKNKGFEIIQNSALRKATVHLFGVQNIKSAEFINYIKDSNTYLEQEPFKKISRNKQLNAFKHYGFWQCMDTLRDKEILEKKIKNKEHLEKK